MHALKLQEKYYNLLKSGAKTVELRLYDDKRKAFREKDIVRFINRSNPGDAFTAEIVKLHLAKDFDSLCEIIEPQQAGFGTKQELLDALEEFYPPEEQKRFGVVGIEIKRQHPL